MSELRATPGPWALFEDEPGMSNLRVTTELREKSSKVCIVTIDVDFEGRIGCEQEANARLIAAAPELYEALDELLQLTQIERPDWQHTEQDRAKSALAKARGES